MSAERLIELIEERQLLPARLVEKLRAKLAESVEPMPAERLANFLVVKNHLSSAQVAALLDEASTADSELSLVSDENLTGDSSIFSGLHAGLAKSAGTDPEAGAGSDDDEVFTLTPIDDDLPLLGSAAPAGGDLEPEPASISRQMTADELFVVGEPVEEPSAPLPTATPAIGPLTAPAPSAPRGAPGLRKKAKKKSQWESPLFLAGAGLLAVLLICGVVVALILQRRGGDEKLAEARQFRDAGAFGQAVTAYQEFVAEYTYDPSWSDARVELAIARIRQASEGGGDPQAALKIAQDELLALESDRNFDQQKLAEARPELAELLPQIAAALATSAEQSDQPERALELAKSAGDAVVLCRNAKFVSKELRDDAALADIEAKLSRVARRQQSRRDLGQAVVEMQTSVAAGDVRAAYDAHKRLVELHPELASDDALLAAVAAASKAEQAGIKFVADEHAAQTGERPTPWLAVLTPTNRQLQSSAPAEGTFCARIDGALDAFDVATGQLLWRRYVGFATGLSPITVGDQVLVVDSKHRELLCLALRGGELVWRQEFGEQIATPLAVAGRLFVAAESGRLFVVDLTSGKRLGYLQFAQPLRVTPAVDRTGRWLYLTGDHTSIYSIVLNDLTCCGVFYLGHSSGSIRVPPVQVLDRLAVIENDGIATCKLRILSVDKAGAVARVETERRLKGLAASSPLVASRRLIVVTDRGELDAYDVSSADGDRALTQVATREPTSREPIMRHVLLTQGAIWVGDTRLTKYAILPTGNRMPAESIDDSFIGSTFDHPLALFDDVLIHVRRVDRRAGVVVTAIDANSGRTLWTNELAVPPVAAPIVDDARRTLALADMNGLVYRFDDATLRSRVQDQPLSPAPSTGTASKLTVAVDLGAGRGAFAAPTEGARLLLYDPAAASTPLRQLNLPSTIACAMAPLGNGVLVPLEVGQIFFLDPSTGEPFAAPFQPRVEPRMKVPYQPPAQADDSGRQFVITDSHDKIYLVELVDEAQPYFKTVTEQSVGPFPIVGPLRVVDGAVIAACDGGQLARFSLPALENIGQTELPGDAVWGPYQVGDMLVVATANEQLVAVRADGSIAWAAAIGDGDLAGPPLEVDGGLLLAYRKGTVEKRTLADGQVAGRLDVGHPLAAGPVSFLDRTVLTGHDGTLFVVQQP